VKVKIEQANVAEYMRVTFWSQHRGIALPVSVKGMLARFNKRKYHFGSEDMCSGRIPVTRWCDEDCSEDCVAFETKMRSFAVSYYMREYALRQVAKGIALKITFTIRKKELVLVDVKPGHVAAVLELHKAYETARSEQNKARAVCDRLE